MKNPFNSDNLSENERLQNSLEAAGIGTWDIDLVKQQIWWDQRCKQLYGYSGSDLLTYEEGHALVHPQDAARIAKAVTLALDVDSGYKYDVEFRTMGSRDSPSEWLHCKGQAYFDQNGQPYRFSGTAQNVSQSFHTRLKLDESESQLKDLVDNTPDVIKRWDTAGRLLFANPAFEHKTGNANAFLLGKTYMQMGQPDEIAIPFMQAIQQVIITGKPLHHYNDFLTPLGKASFYTRLVPELDHTGHVKSVLSIARDISELKMSELRFKTMFEQAPMAIALFRGRDLILQAANDQILRIWGKGTSSIGLPLIEFLPEVKDQGRVQLLEGVFDTGKAHYGQSTLIRFIKEGREQECYFDFVYAPTCDFSGKVDGVMIMASDVSSQVLARMQLESLKNELTISQHRLHMALETGKLGSYELEIATGHVSCNTQGKANYGLGQDAVLDLETAMLAIDPQDRLRVQQALDLTFHKGINYHSEYRIHWPNGELHWLKSSGYLTYSADGKPEKLVGVTQLITEQHIARQQLEQQVTLRTAELQASVQDLQRSNENLRQFAYIASHDLQEPVRKIQVFCDLLKTRYADQLGQGTGYIEKIEFSVNRMSMLVHDLGDFARLSTYQDHSSRVPLSKVINLVCTGLDAQIQQSGAIVHADSLPTVLGNEAQLVQLFLNLIGNSIKFRRMDRALEIKITYQIVTALELPPFVKPTTKAENYYRVQVADNGIGFDQIHTLRIFQVFQKLHAQKEFEGTGIGLAICEKIAANHGGAISASGHLDQGALFSVYLPVSKP